MSKIELRLLKIQCDRLTEKKDDEIYFECAVEFEDGRKPQRSRYPKGRSVVKFTEGQIREFDEQLLLCDVQQGCRMVFRLREQDGLGRLTPLNRMDDHVGAIEWAFDYDGSFRVVHTQDAQFTQIVSDDGREYVFKGSGAEYYATLQIRKA